MPAVIGSVQCVCDQKKGCYFYLYVERQRKSNRDNWDKKHRKTGVKKDRKDVVR